MVTGGELVLPRWRSGSASHLYIQINEKVTRSIRVRGILFFGFLAMKIARSQIALAHLNKACFGKPKYMSEHWMDFTKN
jgi:hypothetical protein